jgi:hypothetical protein
MVAILPTIFSALLVIAGWWVANKAAQKRDDTKGRRELIVKTADAISEQVNKLMTTALAYHTNQQRLFYQEVELNSGLKDLYTQINFLNQASRLVTTDTESNDLLKLFRQNITREHFEDEHLGKLDFNSAQLAKIAASCLALRAYLAKIKFAQFL